MRDTDFTANPRRGRLLRPLFSLLALAALMLVSLPMGASAQSASETGQDNRSENATETLAMTAETGTNKSPGNAVANRGTVKISDGLAVDEHPDNDPHVGCDFSIDYFGFDGGERDFEIWLQPPTGTAHDVLAHSGSTSLTSAQGNELSGSEPVTFEALNADGVLTEENLHDQQGWHLKVIIEGADGSTDGPKKSKVFWVQCELPTEQPPETGDVTLAKDAIGDAPAGATFVFSVDCDDDAFDDNDIELSDGGTVTIVADAPVGTQCTITETDDEEAATTTFTVDDGDPVETDSVDVTIADQTTVAVLATNDFGPQPPDTGDVTLAKDATGDAPAGATFVFSVDCDDDAFDESGIELSDGDVTRIVDDAPVGTQCTITETDDVDAETTTFTVDDGDPLESDSVVVTIGNETTVAVLATNAFAPAGPETFSLNVLKVDEGDPSNTLQGAQFRLFSDVGTAPGVVDPDDEFEGVCTTGNGGECEFDDLAAGNYLLVETRAPQGFVASSDGPIDVTIVNADEDVTVENAPVAVGGVTAERSEIELEKIADRRNARVGDTVTYTYRITNTGGTTLSDITLFDDKLGFIQLTETVLEPGDSTQVQATHVVTQADAEAGQIINVAVVTGHPPTGDAVDDRARAEVDVVDVRGVTLERPDAAPAALDAPPPAAAPEVEAGELARTGAHARWMLMLAIIAMLGGVAFLRIAESREKAYA